MFSLESYRDKLVEKSNGNALTGAKIKELIGEITSDFKPLVKGKLPKEIDDKLKSFSGVLAAPRKDDKESAFMYGNYQIDLSTARKKTISLEPFELAASKAGKQGEKVKAYIEKSMSSKLRSNLNTMIANKEHSRADIAKMLSSTVFFYTANDDKLNVLDHVTGNSDAKMVIIYGKPYFVSLAHIKERFKDVGMPNGYIHHMDNRLKSSEIFVSGSTIGRYSNAALDTMRAELEEYGIFSNPNGHYYHIPSHYLAGWGQWNALENLAAQSHYKVCWSCGGIHTGGYTSSFGSKTYAICEGCAGLQGYRQIMNSKGFYERDTCNPFAVHDLDPTTLGKKRLYGVEVELNGVEDIHWPSRMIADICSSHWVAKSDGSIDHGVEFVSIPADLDAHRAGFKRITDSPLMPIFRLKNAGIHIHVNRASMTEHTVYKLIKFMNTRANWDFIDLMAGRRANNYCSRDFGRKGHIAYKGEKGSKQRKICIGEKYVAVNTLHDKTIEFRIFNSTKKMSEFMQRLQFVDALCKFAESFPQSMMTFENFVGWYVTHPIKQLKHWKELTDFLNANNHIRFEEQPIKQTKESAKCA